MIDYSIYLSVSTFSYLLLLIYNKDIVIANADTNTVPMNAKLNPLYLRQNLMYLCLSISLYG